MSCKDCQSFTDASGKCYDKYCTNFRGEQQAATKSKPRTPIRKKSARKRKEEKETKAIRKPLPGERCELCNGSNSVSTHEIPAGSHRHRAVYDRRCQLRLCRSCHEDLQSIPYELQICFKIESMVASINEAVGSTAVSLESVREAL